MNKTDDRTTNFEVLREIYRIKSYEYQTDLDIQQAFCLQGELNRTFLIINQTEEFLCQNFSASELKVFLIDLQEQLDEQLRVEKKAQ